MNAPERLPVTAPALFDRFRDRRTAGQRRRARMGRLYTLVHRLRKAVGR
jgi:hypothetical protein